jgi:hypothetical protein
MGIQQLHLSDVLPTRSLSMEPAAATHVVPPTNWRFPMLKGGLLWLIGIPLPIILILFFLGYLH